MFILLAATFVFLLFVSLFQTYEYEVDADASGVKQT